MYVADHNSAFKRNSESRAMPAYEKPPARPVDIYLINGTQMRRILGKRSFVLSILVNSFI